MRIRPFAVIAFFVSLAGSMAGSLAGIAQAEPLRVVASFSILGDIVETVGGDDIDVISIVGPDSDAHTYSPTVSDARAVARRAHRADELRAAGGVHRHRHAMRLLAHREVRERARLRQVDALADAGALRDRIIHRSKALEEESISPSPRDRCALEPPRVPSRPLVPSAGWRVVV